MFLDFGLRLPWLTVVLFWWRDVGIWLLAGGALAITAGAMLYRRWRGDGAWMRLAATIPLIGPLTYWRGVADWSGLLSVLIKHRVTPVEALQQCAAGASHTALRELSGDLAEGVRRGQSLSSLMATDRRVPSSLVPFVAWGEELGALPEAFDAVRDMFTRRVQARTAILHAILPPAMFITIGCFVLMIVGGLFMPLGVLIQALS
jgi:type II secretory pathway component PulF